MSPLICRASPHAQGEYVLTPVDASCLVVMIVSYEGGKENGKGE